VQAADFDNDSKLDLVTSMYATGHVALWRGDGTGGFELVDQFPSRGRLPHKVRVGDLDRDQKLDLVVSHCHSDDSLVIFYGIGEFSFPLSQEILLGEDRQWVEHEIRDILLEDLNGDDRLDIAAACFASGQVVALINESEDGQTRQTFRRETYKFEKAGGKPRAICAADFNQDRKKDLAVALWNPNSLSLLLAK